MYDVIWTVTEEGGYVNTSTVSVTTNDETRNRFVVIFRHVSQSPFVTPTPDGLRIDLNVVAIGKERKKIIIHRRIIKRVRFLPSRAGKLNLGPYWSPDRSSPILIGPKKPINKKSDQQVYCVYSSNCIPFMIAWGGEANPLNVSIGSIDRIYTALAPPFFISRRLNYIDGASVIVWANNVAEGTQWRRRDA